MVDIEKGAGLHWIYQEWEPSLPSKGQRTDQVDHKVHTHWSSHSRIKLSYGNQLSPWLSVHLQITLSKETHSSYVTTQTFDLGRLGGLVRVARAREGSLIAKVLKYKSLADP